VGDIALRFINARGERVRLQLNERIMGVTLEQLRAIPCVIAVAGGSTEVEAIRAVLKSGVANVLVTDRDTGKRLLQ
jgi:DNA-binding transcriptional regulator LsrR (DeoR family)